MKEHFSVRGRISRDEFDLAVARWYTLGMEGCEERSQSDTVVEFTVYFGNEAAARAAADDLRLMSHHAAPDVAAVANEDWNARWRESMEPARLAPGWWVAPQWLPPPLETSDRWIKIEPKMAFGTGHHETTRLAARMLLDDDTVLSGASLLDIGTGSGVLCFVGMLAGARYAVGLEIDRECRENLAENRALNTASEGTGFAIGTLDALRNTARFSLVVMNMIHTESAPLLAACRGLVVEKGQLVWSGILNAEKSRAIDAAAAEGFVLHHELVENEWWCGRLTRTGPDVSDKPAPDAG